VLGIGSSAKTASSTIHWLFVSFVLVMVSASSSSISLRSRFGMMSLCLRADSSEFVTLDAELLIRAVRLNTSEKGLGEKDKEEEHARGV